MISLVVRLQLMHCEKPVRANSFTSLYDDFSGVGYAVRPGLFNTLLIAKNQQIFCRFPDE